MLGVTSVAFLPDGRYIVSSSEDWTIQVWDAQTGDLVGNPLQGHTNEVRSVACSPDGRYIVSGSYDETIGIWDVQTGGQVANPLQEHKWCQLSYILTSGRYIVSGSYDETI